MGNRIMELGELTEEEKNTILELQKRNLELRSSISDLCIAQEDIENRKKFLIQTLRTLPKKEQDFKDSLTQRLGTEKWKVLEDGKIFSED